MKTKYAIAVCLLITASACSSFKEESVSPERGKAKTEEMFYATLEQSGATDATKVYADENLKVLWNADDRISIFNRYTYGYEYAFQGSTGDTAGAFVKEEDDAEFVTGNPLDMIYAVYPYSADNKISNSGEMTVLWPYTQTYKPDSFGIGANVMVSVTSNNQLRFKNVGGYLALKLYGDNVSVTSITLRGNNGEKLSGKATVSASTDEDPMLSFDVSAQGSIRLNCTQPVAIGTTADDATIFWLVVPPTQFTQGFNITVRTSDGGIFFKSTDANYDIERNTLCRMAAVEVVPGDIIPFEDANFKAYCVENFDTDSDGEISLSEALIVTAIDVCTDNIYSLAGVEFFSNLQNLYARGSAAKYLNADGWSGGGYGDASSLPEPAVKTSVATGMLSEVNLSCLQKLQKIDISFNNSIDSFDPGLSPLLWYISCEYCNIKEINVRNYPALTYLKCNCNQLTSLDLSDNTALIWLWCGMNQLSSLHINNNTALALLSCQENQLTSLVVSGHPNLTTLECGGNQLSVLDVSSNAYLTWLSCYHNLLTSLDVSNNTALTNLFCEDNQLSSLDVSHNLALINLSCHRNHLSVLDVSFNTALNELCCDQNQLTSLNVSNNTALTSLSCVYNQLTSLDISHNLGLTDLGCSKNHLTTLDVCNNTILNRLNCTGNQLTVLDVSYNTVLIELGCAQNQLTSLDLSNNTALTYLYCADNQLSSLDISHNLALIDVGCYRNQLATLDVSKNTAIMWLVCDYNPYLTEIWLKTGQNIAYLEYDTDVAQVYYKD